MQGVPTFRWEHLGKRKANATDDASLREIKQIGSGWVMTEKVDDKDMARFHVPKCLVEGFDGKVIRFDVTETDAEKNLMKPVPPGPDEYEIYEGNLSRVGDGGAFDLTEERR
jgi:hypothetical protein